MKKYFFTLLFLFSIEIVAAQLVYEKVFDNTYMKPRQCVLAGDKIFSAGYFNFNSSFKVGLGSNLFISTTNADSIHFFADSFSYYSASIAAATDGKYFYSGGAYMDSSKSMFYEDRLCQFDLLGNLISQKLFTTNRWISVNRTIISKVLMTANALYLISSGSDSAQVLKLNKNLQLVWRKKLKVIIYCYADAWFSNNQQKIFIVGRTFSNNNYDTIKAIFSCIDTSGKIVFEKKYLVDSNFHDCQFDRIFPSKNGGYLISGNFSNTHDNSNPYSKNGNLVWLKMNDTGTITWSKKFYNNHVYTDSAILGNIGATETSKVIELADGSIIGMSNFDFDTVILHSIDYHKRTGYIFKYLPKFDSICWRFDFDEVELTDFVVDNNNSLYAVGVSHGNYYQIKLDNIDCMVNECRFGFPSFNKNGKIFPNPTHSNFYVQTDEPLINATLQVHDGLGRLVMNNIVSSQNTFENKWVINTDLSSLINGFYYFQILSNNKIVEKGKIIKQ